MINFGFALSIYILILLVFVILSSLVSSAEAAFFSITPSERVKLKNSKGIRNSQLVYLTEHPKNLLAAFVVASNFLNLGIIILSTFLTGRIISVFEHPVLALLLQVVVITLVLLLVCDIIPKVFATGQPVKVALRLVFFVLMIRALFYPFASLLTFSTGFMDKYILRKKNPLSAEDLSEALALTSSEIPQVQHRLLKDILQLGNKDVKEIMQPRIDLVAFDEKTKFNELLQKAVESGFSRIPVYRASSDYIVGLLYTKDLLIYMGKDDTFNWKHLLRPVFFIPESKKISDLIEDFRGKKTHIAIVVDEFGSTSGIVTFEDIVEEILGEINDEFDEDKLVYSKLDDSNYVFEGKVSLRDFSRTINADEALFQLHKGTSDTLAGFIMELCGRIPEKNEKINFSNLMLTIEAADKKTIQRVKVSLLTQEHITN